MNWRPGVIWLHVISDALIVLAYASIPFLLLSVVRKRKDISFSWMLLAFGAFILACGGTHLMSIVTLWKPWYLEEGLLKLGTAIASVTTAILLWRLLPVLLRLPSASQMQAAHAELERRTAELALSHSVLETKVAERTQELTLRNEELRRTQSWLKGILHSATDVSILAIDNQGIITFFNSGSERLLGYRAEELVGKSTPYIIYPPDQCELRARQLSAEIQRPVKAEEIFQSAHQGNQSFIFETVYLHRDGTRLDVSLAVSPMLDAKGERMGKLAIAVDTRMRHALEKQLTENNLRLQEQTRKAEDANRAKSDFLSAMSHEIRTPMNAILGMADLLWESELNETQRKYVSVFRRACSNLLSLVNDILDLSKIESGRFELERVDFDLNDLVQLTVDMIRPKTETKNLVMTSSVAPDTPNCLIGDPTRLQQILANLLGNAAKFTETGTIHLAIEPVSGQPGRLHFAVSDTGVGIPADKLESIFRDFEQAESSTTRRFGGTGLGLGICRRLVQRMGGELKVTSELGKGSCFYFDAAFELSSKEERPRPEAVAGLRGRRVLIIDDNKINRLIFAEICRAWDMIITESDDIQAGISILEAACKESNFDLVIVDRVIYGLDGLERVARIRSLHAELPILVITSDNIPGDQTKVLSLGKTEYAVKPVRRPDLLRLVSKLLASPQDTKPEKRVQEQPMPIANGQKLRILIVDDSEDNQFLMQEYLKSEPFTVTFAEDGKAGAELAKTRNFDLILMDAQMPIMDGLTATKMIRAEEKEAGLTPIPVLALTASAGQEDMALSRAAGSNAHISKPISKEELIRAIRRYAADSGKPEKQDAVTLTIPSGLEEAAKRYISSRSKETSILQELLANKDYERIRVLAHNIAGTGRSYGFSDLTDLGRTVETSAREQNAEGLAEQLLALSNYVNKAERAVLSLQLVADERH